MNSRPGREAHGYWPVPDLFVISGAVFSWRRSLCQFRDVDACSCCLDEVVFLIYGLPNLEVLTGDDNSLISDREWTAVTFFKSRG